MGACGWAFVWVGGCLLTGISRWERGCPPVTYPWALLAPPGSPSLRCCCGRVGPQPDAVCRPCPPSPRPPPAVPGVPGPDPADLPACVHSRVVRDPPSPAWPWSHSDKCSPVAVVTPLHGAPWCLNCSGASCVSVAESAPGVSPIWDSPCFPVLLFPMFPSTMCVTVFAGRFGECV